MSTIDQREEARYRQDVLASYRAWLAYLEAQQTLLAAAAESQRGLDPFEGLSPSQERAEAARRRIATLPADRRELFDAIYEQERQQIQRQLDQEAQVRGGTVKRADPEEVARRALTRLHEEARGLHRDDRRGMLPRGKPDAVKWLAIDLAELEQSPPSETDYQIAGGRRKVSRSVLVNLIFAGLALLAIPITHFPAPATWPAADGQWSPNGKRGGAYALARSFSWRRLGELVTGNAGSRRALAGYLPQRDGTYRLLARWVVPSAGTLPACGTTGGSRHSPCERGEGPAGPAVHAR
ncbi:MAG: hypothetical protein HC927_07015 [Deltaproteobacteria bacterium]|nr:hypothetical protein [Deltaproteobacteria bacterium]